MRYNRQLDVRLHPSFQGWLQSLVETDSGSVDWHEVLGEVMTLIAALENFGRDLAGPETHPVVTARYDLHALRRVPATSVTPDAGQPPVLRILYCFLRERNGGEIAIVLLGGDKTKQGSDWYPANVSLAQRRADEWCRQNPEYQPIIKRGGKR